MNIRTDPFRILLIILSVSGVGACAIFSAYSGNVEMEAYPEIGLKIKVPEWKSEITDQINMWLLLAYPLVENPAADVQYRVKVSVYKLTNKQYRRLYFQSGKDQDSSDWMNSAHLDVSERTNGVWIYIRKDVVGTNGFAYNCAARIKRISATTNEAASQYGGSDQKLIVALEHMLGSIEVLSTNSLARFNPKMGEDSKTNLNERVRATQNTHGADEQ